MCTIKRWWVFKDFWHSGQSFLSLATAGIWYGISVTSLAWAPSGKSSPMKKSQHLLLDPFQGSLLHHNFILSKARLWWHRNWSWSTKSASGYPRCGRQTLILIFTRQSNNFVILGVTVMVHLPPSAPNTPTPTSVTLYPPRLKIQQVNHSLNSSYIAGRKCHSFMHLFSHSPIPINAVQDMVIHLVCHSFSHSFIDIDGTVYRNSSSSTNNNYLSFQILRT